MAVTQPHSPGYPEERVSRMVDRDEEHLRLLGIYHLVVAGISAVSLIVFVLLPLIVGPGFLGGLPRSQPGVPIEQQLLAGLLVGGLFTLLLALNGLSLLQRRHRISSLIIAVVECLSIPVGLILGISTVLVLRRDSVKALYRK